MVRMVQKEPFLGRCGRQVGPCKEGESHRFVTVSQERGWGLDGDVSES